VICYAEGMTRFLHSRGIRIFDYPQFAQTLRDRVRDVAASLAQTAGIMIEHIAKSHIRKEEVVARVLLQRGDHPGLVHIISAMEACDSSPAVARQGKRQDVRAAGQRQMPALLFLLHGRRSRPDLSAGADLVPFRLQFYCNGHGWLARHLTAEGIGYTMADNAFVRIDDWKRAQKLADALSPDLLHRILDRYGAQCRTCSGRPTTGA
jgi:hypothetical protein